MLTTAALNCPMTVSGLPPSPHGQSKAAKPRAKKEKRSRFGDGRCDDVEAIDHRQALVGRECVRGELDPLDAGRIVKDPKKYG